MIGNDLAKKLANNESLAPSEIERLRLLLNQTEMNDAMLRGIFNGSTRIQNLKAQDAEFGTVLIGDTSGANPNIYMLGNQIQFRQGTTAIANLTSSISMGKAGCRMRRDSTQSISYNTETVVDFTVTDYDDNSFVDLANNKIVIPTGWTGRYNVGYFLGWEYNTRMSLEMSYIVLNGTSAIVGNTHVNNVQATQFQGANVEVPLSAGDELQLKVFQLNSAAGAINLDQIGAHRPAMWISRTR